MKYAYYGFGMLLFGAIGLVLIVMMQSLTINNDAEYYNLREAMKASMLESIDYECYRTDARSEDCGYTLKISEQKFVENFTKRFVTTIGGDAKNYSLEFYDIIESPPKASVVIRGMTDNYGIVSDNKSLTITNSLSGILELEHGIETKYRYHSAVIIPEENLNTDNGSEIKEEEAIDDENDSNAVPEDNICHNNQNSVEFGCASVDDSSIENDDSIDDSSIENDDSIDE